MKKLLSNQEKKIVEDIYKAYIYAIPLIVLDLHTQALTNTQLPTQVKAPLNQFIHAKGVATARDREVVHPNIDTVYSKAHMNLKESPLYIHKPAADRYVMAEVIDAYGNCVGIIGSGGIGGNAEAEAVLVGPDYTGELPKELTKIHVPTNACWILARTLKNENDDEEIKKIQSQLYLRPLKEYRNPDYIPPKGNYDPALDFIPYDKFDELSFEEFFAIFNRMIGDNLGKDPNLDLLETVKQYGIGDGLECKLSAFSEAVTEELKGFCQRAKNDMSDSSRKTTNPEFLKNWRFVKPSHAKMANFKWDDLERARVAWAGFGALPADVAIYPRAFWDDAGEVLKGENKYILHFDSEPPVDEFWSLTVYGEDKFLVPNELDRNGINDRSHLQKNEDGSFDLYIQKERPEESKISNWLPVRSGTFELVLRMYYAKEDVLEGKWNTPSIQRV